ncbi:hypothetical protein HDU86_005309 [Geranomyces michiganensis]|nr:hypothetical protein HDU86_005309 [Geranomyces michiganensis]
MATTWHANPLSSCQRATPSGAVAKEFKIPQTGRCAAAGINLDLQLDRTFFIARANVAGRIAVTVANNRHVKVGTIAVHVIGFEETLVPSPARKVFLQHTLHIQDAGEHAVAPTDAVVPGPPDEHGMWLARKGRHVVPFSIPLEGIVKSTPGLVETHGAGAAGGGGGDAPRSAGGAGPLPSSFAERKVGGVRYVVCCTLELKHVSQTTPLPPLTTVTPLIVLESLPTPRAETFGFSFPQAVDAGSPLHAETTAVVAGRTWFGKSGEVRLRATAQVPGGDGAWLAGLPGMVSVEVENGSRRSVDVLTLSLIRRIKTFAQSSSSSSFTAALNASQSPASSSTTLHDTSSLLLPLSFSRNIAAKRVWRRSDMSTGSNSIADAVAGSDDTAATGPVAKWRGVVKGEKRALVVHIDVPISARSIRFASLLDVSYVIQVSIKPRRSRALEVEIPVTILHPASLYVNLPSITVAARCSQGQPTKARLHDAAAAANAEPGYIPLSANITTGTAAAAAERNAGAGGSSTRGSTSHSLINDDHITIPTPATTGTVAAAAAAGNDGNDDLVLAIKTLASLHTVSVTTATPPVSSSLSAVPASAPPLRRGGGTLPDSSSSSLYTAPRRHPTTTATANAIVVPPENPPSPAATRAASTSSTGSVPGGAAGHQPAVVVAQQQQQPTGYHQHESQQYPYFAADGGSSAVQGGGSVRNASSYADGSTDDGTATRVEQEDIAATIDRMFEGFPECEVR